MAKPSGAAEGRSVVGVQAAAKAPPAAKPAGRVLGEPVNVFDEGERDAARDLGGFKGTAHAAGHDEQCVVCRHRLRDGIEAVYLRGDPPSEIARLFDLPSWTTVEAHARGLNLDIELSKNTDRALALMITRGLHDLRPHSVDAKTLLAAIHERNVLDGKVVQRVQMDRPSTIVFMGTTPEPGVVRGKIVQDALPNVPLDVPGNDESLTVTTDSDDENAPSADAAGSEKGSE